MWRALQKAHETMGTLDCCCIRTSGVDVIDNGHFMDEKKDDRWDRSDMEDGHILDRVKKYDGGTFTRELHPRDSNVHCRSSSV